MKQKLQFDRNGYLYPHQPIEVEVEVLKEVFVNSFSNSNTRRRLWDNYERYLYRFQDEVYPYFEQWINGSFVSKKRNPKDIDVVTFLDYRIYEMRSDSMMNKFWSFALEQEGIDAYIIKTYPPEHTLFQDYQVLRDRWLERYTHAKASRDGFIAEKGFLSIQFTKDE